MDTPRHPILDQWYDEYLKDEDTAAFVRKVASRYTVATLERLTERASRVSRRAAVLALGQVANYESNPVLGKALVDQDRVVRTIAENSIRSVWCRVGAEQQQRQLERIIRLNVGEQYDDAVREATVLIVAAAWIAEAWNQRAIAYYCRRQYAEAIEDCRQALEINPYHFGAASGMGQCYLNLGRRDAAIESFRRALKLCPNLENVRIQLNRLERQREKGQ